MDFWQFKDSKGNIHNVHDSAVRTAFTGASSTQHGTQGAVPRSAAGDEDKFLKGDGTWASQHNTEATSAQIDAMLSSIKGG